MRFRKDNGSCFFRAKEEADQTNDGNASGHQDSRCDAPKGDEMAAEKAAGDVANGDGNGDHCLSFYFVPGRKNGICIVNRSRCEQGKGKNLCQKGHVNQRQSRCQGNKNGFQHKKDGSETQNVAAVPSFHESGKADHHEKFQYGCICHDLPQFLIAFADFLQNLNHVGVDGTMGNENEDDAQTEDSKPMVFPQYGNGTPRGYDG